MMLHIKYQQLLIMIYKSLQQRVFSVGLRSLCRMGSKYPDDPDKGSDIRIDEAMIEKKLKQIKQKRQSKKKSATEEADFMPSFRMHSLHKDILDYRKNHGLQELFHFEDQTLEEKPTVLQVTGFTNEVIQVDKYDYPPCLVLNGKQILLWEVQNTKSITIDSFGLLDVISPRPDYVILGVEDANDLSRELQKQLVAKHKNIDILPLFEAVSQYNIAAQDQVNLLAFLCSK